MNRDAYVNEPDLIRPRLRIVGIHREPLPVELKGVVRSSSECCGVFLLGGNGRPVLAAAGQFVGRLPLRVEEVWDADLNRAAGAILRDEQSGARLELVSGRLCFSGRAIATIARDDAEESVRGVAVGDSIDDGMTVYDIEAVSDGPDESVTLSDGEHEYVMVATDADDPSPPPDDAEMSAPVAVFR
ncbi:MAG TPA: hypothetical protein VGM73_00545 [Candidatus Didemnitutus sp.]